MASSSIRPPRLTTSPPPKPNLLRLPILKTIPPFPKRTHFPPLRRRQTLLPPAHCTSTSTSTADPDDFDSAPGPYDLQPLTLKLEKRQKAALLRDSRSSTTVQLPESPNFEVGWKRTKPIDTGKPRGFVVADFLEKLESLMGRGQFGSVELLVKAGGIVVERAREEAEEQDITQQRLQGFGCGDRQGDQPRRVPAQGEASTEDLGGDVGDPAEGGGGGGRGGGTGYYSTATTRIWMWRIAYTRCTGG